MNREEVVKKIEEFRQGCKAYSDLLLDSRDDVFPDIVRNHDLIDEARAKLNRVYASVEKYIKKFGNNPKMNDGVWNVTYSPYDNAFTSDILIRTGRSLDAVIDDLNLVLGRLEAITDSEFEEKINPVKPKMEVPIQNSGIVALGGGGGGGGGGPGGGRGGDGGSVTIGIPYEQVTIKHVKNPHKQYWGMLFIPMWDWIKDHISEIIVGVIITLIGGFLLFHFGWI